MNLGNCGETKRRVSFKQENDIVQSFTKVKTRCYIGVGLIPGMNSTISGITTSAGYGSGVVGMVSVILINNIVTLNSNVHRITCQIRGRLKNESSMLIAELSRKVNNLSGNVERLDGKPLFIQGDGIVRHSTKVEITDRVFAAMINEKMVSRESNFTMIVPLNGERLKQKCHANAVLNQFFGFQTGVA